MAAFSDHLPMWLDIDGGEVSLAKGQKPFRIESMWVGQEACLGTTFLFGGHIENPLDDSAMW